MEITWFPAMVIVILLHCRAVTRAASTSLTYQQMFPKQLAAITSLNAGNSNDLINVLQHLLKQTEPKCFGPSGSCDQTDDLPIRCDKLSADLTDYYCQRGICCSNNVYKSRINPNVPLIRERKQSTNVNATTGISGQDITARFAEMYALQTDKQSKMNPTTVTPTNRKQNRKMRRTTTTTTMGEFVETTTIQLPHTNRPKVNERRTTRIPKTKNRPMKMLNNPKQITTAVPTAVTLTDNTETPTQIPTTSSTKTNRKSQQHQQQMNTLKFHPNPTIHQEINDLDLMNYLMPTNGNWMQNVNPNMNSQQMLARNKNQFDFQQNLIRMCGLLAAQVKNLKANDNSLERSMSDEYYESDMKQNSADCYEIFVKPDFRGRQNNGKRPKPDFILSSTKDNDIYRPAKKLITQRQQKNFMYPNQIYEIPKRNSRPTKSRVAIESFERDSYENTYEDDAENDCDNAGTPNESPFSDFESQLNSYADLTENDELEDNDFYHPYQPHPNGAMNGPHRPNNFNNLFQPNDIGNMYQPNGNMFLPNGNMYNPNGNMYFPNGNMYNPNQGSNIDDNYNPMLQARNPSLGRTPSKNRKSKPPSVYFKNVVKSSKGRKTNPPAHNLRELRLFGQFYNHKGEPCNDFNVAAKQPNDAETEVERSGESNETVELSVKKPDLKKLKRKKQPKLKMAEIKESIEHDNVKNAELNVINEDDEGDDAVGERFASNFT